MVARYFSVFLALAILLALGGLALRAGGTVGDTEAPVVTVSSPAISTSVSKTETFRVSWAGLDPSPSSGIAFYDVQVRAGSGLWTNWLIHRIGTSADYIGNQGAVYHFRARGTDVAGNIGKWSQPTRTRVPYDQDRHLLGRRGFAYTVSIGINEYYLGTFRQSARRGDYVVYKFKGRRFVLISTRAKKMGKAKIFVDGSLRKIIDAYSRTTKYRRIVFEITFRRNRYHTIKIFNLGTTGRPRFDVDGHVL